jgi:hypothetical protein
VRLRARCATASPALSEIWQVSITGINQRGPSLAQDGSLLRAGTQVVLRYWTAPPCSAQDLDCDGSVGPTDIAILLSAWGPCSQGSCAAAIDRDGIVGPADIAALLATWG